MNKFGALLAELRKDRKMTQHELADVIHVSTGTISNYENGVYFPDLENLLALADYFSVTTDYLLGRCKSRKSPDVFMEPFLGGKTIGCVIDELRSLPVNRKKALMITLNDMSLCSKIDHQYEPGDLQ